MPGHARIARLKQVIAQRQSGIVVLEDVHDPHNAQAVFRSCEALGFQTVALVFATTRPWNPRAIGKRSSATANKWLDFERYDSAEACMASLRGRGYETWATVPAGDGEPVPGAPLLHPRPALLLGSEREGLSDTMLALADRRLTITMDGFVRSLNVSVAAALMLYEVSRQRREAGMAAYRLDNATQQRLLGRLLER